VYLLVFLLLYIGALVPIDSVQEQLQRSLMATVIVKHTPVLSDMLNHWWIHGRV